MSRITDKIYAIDDIGTFSGHWTRVSATGAGHCPRCRCSCGTLRRWEGSILAVCAQLSVPTFGNEGRRVIWTATAIVLTALLLIRDNNVGTCISSPASWDRRNWRSCRAGTRRFCRQLRRRSGFCIALANVEPKYPP